MFRDAYFDFVLASYNCIDYLSHDDRIKALEEIKRVCKIGGLVCFSSHNLLYDKLFEVKPSLNPLRLLLAIYRYAWLVALNGSGKRLAKKDYAIINDGAHNFSLKTYYIKPIKQIEQLGELQFNNVRVFSLDGNEILGASELNSSRDCWLYYLCTAA
jgi:ubiquinone/menaquinone biosynthesis C-methylase UbiE